jgi:hypothetical protein
VAWAVRAVQTLYMNLIRLIRLLRGTHDPYGARTALPQQSAYGIGVRGVAQWAALSEGACTDVVPGIYGHPTNDRSRSTVACLDLSNDTLSFNFAKRA